MKIKNTFTKQMQYSGAGSRTVKLFLHSTAVSKIVSFHLTKRRRSTLHHTNTGNVLQSTSPLPCFWVDPRLPLPPWLRLEKLNIWLMLLNWNHSAYNNGDGQVRMVRVVYFGFSGKVVLWGVLEGRERDALLHLKAFFNYPQPDLID